MSQYLRQSYERFSKNIRVDLDLSNYATKADLKGGKEIDKSALASKTDLTSLKTRANNFDVDNLKTVFADLRKLSNAVDNNVDRKKLRILNWLPKPMLVTKT